MIGWWNDCLSCSICFLPFWNFQDEIGNQDSILFKRDKIIIPTSLQRVILRELFASHQGVENSVESMEYTGQECIETSRMLQLITSPVKNYQVSTPIESMHQHKTHTYTWQYVSADLFTITENEYLLRADQYSPNPFTQCLHSTSSTTVIRNIKAVFKDQGIPEILYTDNGPQFASWKFVDFYKKYTFLHKTSSLHYLQSNGFTERIVGVGKSILLKVQETRHDHYIAMMHYRATPVSANLKSFTELLYGRQIQTLLVSK